MSPEATFIFLLAAVVCFAVATFYYGTRRDFGAALISLGLAAWVFVPFWTALKAL